jgi:hypothetical protein
LRGVLTTERVADVGREKPRLVVAHMGRVP